MLKYKYSIDHGDFSSIEDFQEYLNKMGNKGYELVQWRSVNAGLGNMRVVTTWKIEDHD